MSYELRYSPAARADIEQLFSFLAQKDISAARDALEAIDRAAEFLREFPFACRKADPRNPFLRELVISFGSNGYVALFEIDDETTVTVLAVRHQREEDYH